MGVVQLRELSVPATADSGCQELPVDTGIHRELQSPAAMDCVCQQCPVVPGSRVPQLWILGPGSTPQLGDSGSWPHRALLAHRIHSCRSLDSSCFAGSLVALWMLLSLLWQWMTTVFKLREDVAQSSLIHALRSQVKLSEFLLGT